MRPIVGGGSTHGYASVLEDVGRDLRPTLRALEGLAAAPELLADGAAELPSLQYTLHLAGERVLGVEPLPGLEEAHEELAAALAIAREETADVLAALDGEAAAAEALVWEWRAALFGVRLALAHVEQPAAVAAPAERLLAAALNVALLAIGVLAVLGGALVQAWPVWVAGLVLVAASTALTRRAA